MNVNGLIKCPVRFKSVKYTVTNELKNTNILKKVQHRLSQSNHKSPFSKKFYTKKVSAGGIRTAM